MPSMKDIKVTVVDTGGQTTTFIQRSGRAIDVCVNGWDVKLTDGIVQFYVADKHLDGLIEDLKMAQQMRRLRSNYQQVG
jgi:hypothetical protein